MAEIDDLYITAANNTARFPEGLAASGYNDSARELEAMLARWFKDTGGALISTGSASAYGITTSRTYAAYAGGMSFRVRFHVDCNATPTFAVGALAAKDLVRQTGSDIVAGDIQAGMIADVSYDSANDRFVVLGLDDREKAAVYTTAQVPSAAAANEGVLYAVSDPPGSNYETALVMDTGARLMYLRERVPAYTQAAGSYRRPQTSSSSTTGKVSLRTDHPATMGGTNTVLAFDNGATWIDIDDIVEVFAEASLPSPTASAKGWIVYDDTNDVLRVWNATEWDKVVTYDKDMAAAPVPTYTVATLPAASSNPRVMVYCSNESGGATIAFSDGTNWRRVQDRAIVS